VERVVYSFVAYRTRFQRGTGCLTVSSYTGLARETVRRAMKVLAGHGLVAQKGGRWYAHQPPAACEGWFRQPAKLAKNPHWALRLQYDAVYLPRPGAPLNMRTAVVYCLAAKCRGRDRMKRELARKSGLAYNTVVKVLGRLAALGNSLPDTFFQEGGKKLKPRSGVAAAGQGHPQDYISAALVKAGVLPQNLAKVHGLLQGYSPDQVERLIAMSQGYDRSKYADCSFLLAYKIKQGVVQKVARPPDVQPRCDDVTKREFWDPRVRLYADHYHQELVRKFSPEQLAKVGSRVPAYYWDQMPGATLADRMDRAEEQKISVQDLYNLLSDGQA
jgi:hypothetical protein